MTILEPQYAPVLIPTLCRYEHFKRCIESLSACTGAEYTDVYIGLDYPAKESHRVGYEQIKHYLDECGNLGFKSLNVIKRPHNYGFGPHGNALSLRREVFKKFDCIITSEDDNEFSPCFLDYMNKALTKYRDNERVRSVGAWVSPQLESKCSENVMYTYSTSAWGLGIWKQKEDEVLNFDYESVIKDRRKSWKLFKMVPGCWVMLYRMLDRGVSWGDVKRETYNCLNNTFQVRPCTSLVRNWGNDGSGVHCVVDNERFVNAAILQENSFGELPNVVPATQSVSRVSMFFHNLPPRHTFRCWFVLAKYFAVFLKAQVVGIK